MNRPAATYVEETRFGFWFLQSRTWRDQVLRVAITELNRLVERPRPMTPVLLDAGCGQGRSFHLLARTFRPSRLIGLDADPLSLEHAHEQARKLNKDVQLLCSDCAQIDLPDACVDIVFCHQTLHHLVEQEKALAEFWRVLKPGGWLLVAESTKYFIDTWVIRWLFRHPMHVQRSAEEYLDMLRGQGFDFSEHHVSYPYPWWSRASDFGLCERLRLCKPKPFGQRHETLLNVAARKPTAPAS